MSLFLVGGAIGRLPLHIFFGFNFFANLKFFFLFILNYSIQGEVNGKGSLDPSHQIHQSELLKFNLTTKNKSSFKSYNSFSCLIKFQESRLMNLVEEIRKRSISNGKYCFL